MPQPARYPAVSPALFPDPVLSANVYCSGRLCEVIARLVAPFWSQYRRLSTEPSSYVWLLRYARCGEHLKIRLHGPESEAPLLRELLAAAQESYFASCDTSPAAETRVSRPSAPPVDAEDRAAADYPDRTFLWTEYGRHHLSLGFRPCLTDDDYAALLTRCLGRGTEVVLERFAIGPDGKCPYAIQRALWLDLLLTGLRAAGLSPHDRSLYLLYHRDCLMRYLRKQRHWTDGASVMERLISRLDQRAEQQRSKRRELAKAVADVWEASAPELEAGLVAWFEALRALSTYVRPLLSNLSYQVDPFAERPVFPALFKVFHGMANEIGLDPLNEAFLHHLLLSETGGPELRHRPVRLRPEL